MNTSQLIKKAASRLNTKEEDAKLYLETFANVISEGMQKGDEVSLKGFGDFFLELKWEPAEGAGTGPCAMRNAKRKVVFVPSKRLERAVNRW